MDDLTELQNRYEELSTLLYNSIGVLHDPKTTYELATTGQDGAPDLPTWTQQSTANYVKDIGGRLTVIQEMIAKMPNGPMEDAEYTAKLAQLTQENERADAELAAAVNGAESSLAQVRHALRTLADLYLSSSRLRSGPSTGDVITMSASQPQS
eukprot:TRINITY_DN34097_c0_g1_i1.p1 TRINITY_DN34097_c0_g1~~TRINITY_DN34097_c0_g1_i1.p1  ORF type:complete len:175 (+),score=15.78 TRINITY_DN34097_c0_g1_i1:67-525(+)